MSLQMVRAIEGLAAARPFTEVLLAYVANHRLLLVYKVWSWKLWQRTSSLGVSWYNNKQTHILAVSAD